ncbi:cell division protein PerM [Phytoactinopolyspora mesophila]|uniref:Uncharacterized protein n=1 Tax=Phytoactinopolyspora mesophila TaxID=2650750 RepID=A0A7K3M5E6_9ACTN|nr:DUF6350 family protein [Phytoactinopolyspora mesophila]NDL58465.1 hypothetical protein [Phytoactinopolyspora mesophila]
MTGEHEKVPDLLTRPLLRREDPAWGTRVPWFASVLASGWVLVATLAMSALPGVAVWISDGADGPLSGPLRFGARLWLLSHRVGLDVDGAGFVFVPLGLTILFVLLMYRSGRWAAHQAGTATPKGIVMVVGPAVGLYAIGAGLLAAFASSGGVSSSPFEAAGWAGLWALGGFAVGVLHETGFDEVWLGRIAPEVRAALAGSAAAVAGLVLFGATLLVMSAAANSAQIGMLADALDAGPVGNIALALGGGAVVPNAMIWAASFALGPGFVVGTETVVAPAGVELGMVPALPVLGALPADLPGAVIWAVLAGPVAAGILAGVLVQRRLRPHEEPMSIVILAAGGAGAAAALGMSVLALLSGGSVGAARLSEVGPVPWEVAAMTFVAVGVPCMITAALLAWRQSAPE